MEIKIVGGGAAGLISALYLANNHKPTIFEKQSKKDYSSTLCAEATSLNKLKLLKEETGFDSSPYISKKIKGVKLIFPNKCKTYLNHEFVTLERTSWQNGMIDFLQKKGTEINFSTEIGGADEINYDYLIGADGVNSKIRKKIGAKIETLIMAQYKMNLDRNVSYLEAYVNELFYTENQRSYGWIFPKEDHYNVGCGGTFETLDKFLKEYGIKGEIIEKSARPIGVKGTKFSSNSGNILLTGDAAGLANSLTGEGLSQIIESGRFITQHIEEERNYENSIESSYINPEKWKGYQETYLRSNKVFNSIGTILNDKNVLEIPFSTKLKTLFRPAGFPYLAKVYRMAHQLSETF